MDSVFYPLDDDDIILNKLSKLSDKCNPKLRLIFLTLSISGIVKAGRNTLCKYEYEYQTFLPYS